MSLLRSPAWCREKEEIMKWLIPVVALARPFVKPVGRMLVRLALDALQREVARRGLVEPLPDDPVAAARLSVL
jgi:hypothetical protein